MLPHLEVELQSAMNAVRHYHVAVTLETVVQTQHRETVLCEPHYVLERLRVPDRCRAPTITQLVNARCLRHSLPSEAASRLRVDPRSGRSLVVVGSQPEQFA